MEQSTGDDATGITTADALALARKWHGDQLDKLGEDYVSGHVTRVQRTVAERGGDVIAQIAAALHDTLEDTEASPGALAADGVPRQAIHLVQELTRRDDESYEAFIERIAEADDRRAILIKQADLYDNSDPVRVAALSKVDPDGARRRLARYTAAIHRLDTA